MIADAVTVSENDMRKLLGAASPEAALLLGLAVDMAHHALDPRLKNASTDLQEVL